MKKSLWMFLVLGLAFAVQGCGFDPTIDSSVMIVKVTPTPEATQRRRLPQHRKQLQHRRLPQNRQPVESM